MGFGVVQRLIGTPHDRHRRFLQIDVGVTGADGNAPDLRKMLRLYIAAETFKNPVCIVAADLTQQHHKFFTAEAEQAVIGTERSAQ